MRQGLRKAMTFSIISMIALSLAVACPQVWAAEKKDDKAVLDEVLDVLKEKGQITEEKYQELKTRAKKEGAGKILAGFDGVTPFIRSADGEHIVKFTSRVHFDMRAYEDGSRNLNGTDLTTNFLIRRARLGMYGTFFKHLDAHVEADFGEGTAQLILAFVDLNYWPEFRLRGGQFKVPFSFEQLNSSRFIDFVERSIVDTLVPAFDVGFQLHGSLAGGLVEYAGGLFNGQALNIKESNDSKDFAGRILVRPFKDSKGSPLEKLHIAGHFTHGDQDSAQSLRGRTDGKFVFFDRVSTRGDRLRYGFEAVYALGPLGLYGEYVQSEEERKGLGSGGKDLDDLTGRGWYVAATALLTGEDKLHGKAPKVKRNFDPRKGDFGAVELAARFAQLDFDSKDVVGNRLDALTVGVNWYLSPNVRLMFNWTQNWFEDLKRTPFSAGKPTNTNDSSWEILSRLALWF